MSTFTTLYGTMFHIEWHFRHFESFFETFGGFFMKNILLRLRELESTMSSTEKAISTFIRNNPEKSSCMTVRQLAEATYSSPSSVVRLCRMIGFEGYKDFRQFLFLELATLTQDDSQRKLDISATDSVSNIIDKVTLHNMNSLEDTRYLLDPEIVSICINLLIQSQTILLFGMSASLYVAKDTYLKFLRLNKSCIANEDYHSQLVQAKNSSPKDVAIIFSYSGQTVEMVECMKILKKNKTPVIAITRYSSSPISRMADYNLYISANETLFRSGAMASRIVQLNISDILYTGYMNALHDQSMERLTQTHITKEDLTGI